MKSSFCAWVPLLLVFLLAAHPAGANQGGASSTDGLRPGEVRVSLFYSIFTTYRPTDREAETSSGKGNVVVRGNFAAKLSAPEPGKRTLTNFRRLPGSFTGRLADAYHFERTREFGEGGWQAQQTTRKESWDAGEMEVDLPNIFLVIDLDAGTWSIPDFENGPNRWFSQLVRAQSFWGSYLEPGNDGKPFWRVSGNPLDSVLGGVTWISRTGKDLASAPSSYSFGQLAQPGSLQRGQGYLGGSSEGHVSPNVAGFQVAWGMNWGIYEALPELELRVTAPNFENWRPEAGADPDARGRMPGPPLVLTARLIRPGGGDIGAARIRRMRWSLLETSRLPGVAMNFPYRSQDTAPDLEIDHPRATNERQRLVLEDLTVPRATVRIRPYDWGGWSTLEVEAELDDGRRLKGVYAGPAGDESPIRLPARDANSKIARSWRQQMNATGADDSDDDQIPPGKSSVLGDGFSLFEEYRGFYVGAQAGSGPSAPARRGHVSTDPRYRDVFVFDRRNDADTRDAIALFARASGLSVHVIHITDGYLDESRLMNANRGSGPTRGDQHAIGIMAGQGPFWRPVGAGGRPGTSDLLLPRLAAFEAEAPRLKSRPDLYRRAIAQALLRSCGVPRPGKGDESLTLTITRRPDGGPEVVANGKEKVTLRDETGHDVGEDWLRDIDRDVEVVRHRLRGLPTAPMLVEAARTNAPSRPLYVARQGGEHSGPLANIMRHTFADAYRFGSSSTLIVLPKGFRETMGTELPTTSAGDGYNAAGARPRRYGDSPNPPAASSLVVNDHAP